jgi:hypothetical protein
LAYPHSGLAWYQLVAADGVVVAYSGSDEAESWPDVVFDPSGDGGWEELPPDPLSPAFDRTMVWSRPHLYLFDHELVAHPGSAAPPLTRVARLVPVCPACSARRAP